MRNQQNVVLILLPHTIYPPQTRLLTSLSGISEDVRENETRVIVVVRPEQLHTAAAISNKFIAATHVSGEMFAELCGDDGITIYFTDKFREVFHVHHTKNEEPFPEADDILKWIRSVAMQCPECHPPEWRADALKDI